MSQHLYIHLAFNKLIVLLWKHLCCFLFLCIKANHNNMLAIHYKGLSSVWWTTIDRLPWCVLLDNMLGLHVLCHLWFRWIKAYLCYDETLVNRTSAPVLLLLCGLWQWLLPLMGSFKGFSLLHKHTHTHTSEDCTPWHQDNEIMSEASVRSVSSPDHWNVSDTLIHTLFWNCISTTLYYCLFCR